METIRSRDNAKIKEIVRLMSSRNFRTQTGLFAAEGIRLCKDIYRSGIKVEKCFASLSAYEKLKEEKPEFLLGIEEKLTLVSDELAEKIADTKATQGLFFICKTLDNLLSADKIKNNGCFVGLVNLQDPGNVGTIIRTAEALGLDGLVLTADCTDIYSPKVLRATMGSLFRLPVYIAGDASALLDTFEKLGYETYAAVLNDSAVKLGASRFSVGSIAFIGNEGNGLPVDFVKRCRHSLMIPMAGSAESLNAAVAASIIIWEMTR